MNGWMDPDTVTLLIGLFVLLLLGFGAVCGAIGGRRR